MQDLSTAILFFIVGIGVGFFMREILEFAQPLWERARRKSRKL